MKLGISNNIDAVVSKLRRVPRLVQSEMMAAQRDGAERIMRASKRRTPSRTGRLAESHRVIKTKDGYTVSVGDEETWYATIVHEDLSLTHDDGEAKFLETSVLEETESIRRDIAKATERAFKKADL